MAPFSLERFGIQPRSTGFQLIAILRLYHLFPRFDIIIYTAKFSPEHTMTATDSARRAGLFTLHQFTLLTGILLFPLVLATRRVGVRLGLDRTMARISRAYATQRETEG